MPVANRPVPVADEHDANDRAQTKTFDMDFLYEMYIPLYIQPHIKPRP